MSTIRALVLKVWFKFFFGSFASLLLLITVAELITGFLRNNVTPMEVIFNHFIELTDKMKLILPVSCLSASLFTVNKLKNRNELVAIFASGYSRKKFMQDIAYGALLIAFIQLLFSSFIEPLAKSQKDFLIEDGQSKFKNLYAKGLMASTIGSGRMWFKNDEYFFTFSSFDRFKSELKDVSAYFYNSKRLLVKKLKTPILRNVNNQWVGDKTQVIEELHSPQYPVISLALNFIWPIRESPGDFKELEADITTLNAIKLYNYISKLQEGGINVNEYMVLLLEKVSISLVCLVFGLIAAVGCFQPNRRGSSFGKSFLSVFVFVIFYWLINSYFIEMGKSSKLNPYVACFGVPLLFSTYLFYIFYKNRTLNPQ